MLGKRPYKHISNPAKDHAELTAKPSLESRLDNQPMSSNHLGMNNDDEDIVESLYESESKSYFNR
jgi:hypothetical protein